MGAGGRPGLGAAYGALVVFQLNMSLWASLGSKALLGADVPIVGFLFGRHLLTSLALGGVGATRGLSLKPERGDVTRLFAAGLLAQFVSPVFYMWGMRYVAPTVGSILDGPCVPLIVYAIVVAAGLEQLPRSRRGRVGVLASLAMAILGAGLLIATSGNPSLEPGLEPDPEGADAESSGMFWAAVVSLAVEASCLSASLVLQKPLAQKYELVPFGLWISLAGLVACASHLAAFGGIAAVLRLLAACASSPAYLAALLFNTFANSLANTLLLAFAQQRLPSSVVAMAACLQPALTLALDAVFFGATVSLANACALALVACGTYSFTRIAAATPAPTPGPDSKSNV